MAERDLSSHSDESDEDFVPDAHCSSEEDDISAADSSDDSGDEETGPKSRKRRKVSKKKRKKGGDDETSGEKGEETEKTEKTTDVDSLWADFKEDVSKMEKQKVSNQEKVEEKEVNNVMPEKKETIANDSNSTSKAPIDNKRKGIPNTMNSNSKLGLSKILNQIGKKDKMSTLAKSKLDWNNFKKSEGIEEEIKTYNKGKDGYLEKQDFLQRTDLRQFELEKQLRTSRRNC